MFQKADFISTSTTASFSLILLQRATVQSYNEVIFFPAMNILCSVMQTFSNLVLSPFQIMIDLITELSKAFPHQGISLTKDNFPNVKKVQAARPFKMKAAC